MNQRDFALLLFFAGIDLSCGAFIAFMCGRSKNLYLLTAVSVLVAPAVCISAGFALEAIELTAKSGFTLDNLITAAVRSIFFLGLTSLFTCSATATLIGLSIHFFRQRLTIRRQSD